MKLCIVKQRYVPGYTRKSTRWAGANEMLDAFMLRSKNYGLLHQEHGDVWVVEDDDYVSSTYAKMAQRKPDAIKKLYATQTAVAWDDVPWQQYQAVITLDPIAPRRLIEEYPQILWCYYASEHSGGDWRNSGEGPLNGYDVFLDHTRTACGETVALRLPAVMFFPSIVSRFAFADVIDTSDKADAVFLDSHAIRRVEDLHEYRLSLTRKFGVAVLHPEPWDYARSFECAADGLMMSTREYLQAVASCRLFWHARAGAPIGQSIPEAAGLGCIVLASKRAKYADVCHPFTQMDDASSEDEAAAIVDRLMQSPALRSESIQYQNSVLDDVYLNRPIDALNMLLQVKRRG